MPDFCLDRRNPVEIARALRLPPLPRSPCFGRKWLPSCWRVSAHVKLWQTRLDRNGAGKAGMRPAIGSRTRPLSERSPREPTSARRLPRARISGPGGPAGAKSARAAEAAWGDALVSRRSSAAGHRLGGARAPLWRRSGAGAARAPLDQGPMAGATPILESSALALPRGGPYVRRPSPKSNGAAARAPVICRLRFCKHNASQRRAR